MCNNVLIYSLRRRRRENGSSWMDFLFFFISFSFLGKEKVFILGRAKQNDKRSELELVFFPLSKKTCVWSTDIYEWPRLKWLKINGHECYECYSRYCWIICVSRVGKECDEGMDERGQGWARTNVCGAILQWILIVNFVFQNFLLSIDIYFTIN